jgi:hypothetical protein
LETSISCVIRRPSFHFRLSLISNWVEMIFDRVQQCESFKSLHWRSRYSILEQVAKPLASS